MPSREVCCWNWILAKYAPKSYFEKDSQGALDYANCLAAPLSFKCDAASLGSSSSPPVDSNPPSSATKPPSTSPYSGIGGITVYPGTGGQSNASCTGCTGLDTPTQCIQCVSSVLSTGLVRIGVNLLLALVIL